MKKVKGLTNRIVAMLLSGMLVVGAVPGTVFASETPEDIGQTSGIKVEEAGEMYSEEVSAEEGMESEEIPAEEGMGSEEVSAEEYSEDEVAQEEEAVTSYTVTLDANGGYFSNEWDDKLGETVEMTDLLTKAIPVGGVVSTYPVKEQDNAVVPFLGWSFERGGELVSQGYEEYIPVDNCVLYAVWQTDETVADSEESSREESDGMDNQGTDIVDENKEQAEQTIEAETIEAEPSEQQDLQSDPDRQDEQTEEESVNSDSDSSEEVSEFAGNQDEQGDFDASQFTLYLGKNQIEITDESACMAVFVPETEDTYTFFSTGEKATSATLYTSEGDVLAQDEGSGENGNFLLSSELNKDVTYVLLVDVTEGVPGQKQSIEVTSGKGLCVGSNTIAVSEGEETVIKFIPEQDGSYVFSSLGDQDTYGTLYDQDMDFIEGSDDDGDDYNFRIVCDLTAGNVYYLGSSFYDNSISGPVVLSVVSCYGHVAEEGSDVVIEPTCTEQGYTSHTCQNCGSVYRDSFVEPTDHLFDADGLCSICGEETSCMIRDAEIVEDSEGQTFIQVVFKAEQVESQEIYAEIYDEGSTDPVIVKNIPAESAGNEEGGAGTDGDGSDDGAEESGTQAGETGRDGVTVLLSLDGETLPEFFVIKAYIAESGTGTIVSNIYENRCHTREYEELMNVDPSGCDPRRTVEFGDDNFGVLDEDIVLIHGSDDVNVMVEDSEGCWLLYNANEEAQALEDGCCFAYFLNNELQLAASVESIESQGESEDELEYLIYISDPELEDVFELLRIEENTAGGDFTVDTSDLDEGVTFLGTEDLPPQDYESGVSEEAGAAAINRDGLEEEKEGLSEDEEYVSTPAANAYVDTGTTIGNTFNYKLDMGEGDWKLTGRIGLGLQFPVSILISNSIQEIHFGGDVSLKGSVSFEGEAEMKVPLGTYTYPIAGGLFLLRTTPSLVGSVSGNISLSLNSTGSVRMAGDTINGLRVTSYSFDAAQPDITLEGTLFTGVEIAPELDFAPKKELCELSMKIGPEFQASYTVPISEEDQEPGDHMCQSCLQGEGRIILSLSAAVTAWKKKLRAENTFSIKGYEFYHSFTYGDGGHTSCPHIKPYEDDPDNPDNPHDPGNDPDDPDDPGDDPGSGPSSDPGNDEIENVLGYIFDEGTNTLIGVLNPSEWIDGHVKVINTTGKVGSYYTPNYHYTVDDDGNITEYWLKWYVVQPLVEHVTIPQGVTKIGSFYGWENLKSIDIPSSVNSIDANAFYGCTSLTSISIPDGVTCIENSTFRGCSSLTRVELPDELNTIEDYAFFDCGKLSDIVMPPGLKQVGESAFGNCESIKSVDLSNVSFIGPQSFSGCTGLTEVNIPHAKHIGMSAFAETGLKYVELPEVETIGTSAFHHNDSLTGVKIGKASGLEANQERPEIHIGDYAFYSCPKLKEIETCDADFWIDNGAFSTSGLKSLDISSVKKLGANAFEYCPDLHTVSISGDFTQIKEFTFYECRSLKNVRLPETITSIGKKAFVSCEAMTAIPIPSSVSVIGERAFYSCDSFEKIIIPTGVTEIQNEAFAYCENVTDIVIPETVSSIGDRAFNNCNNVSYLKIPNGVRSVGDYAFNNCWIKTLELPDSLKHVGRCAFIGNMCSNLTIPKNLTEIGEKAFAYNQHMDTLTIKKGATIIGKGMFYGCYMDTVTIPDSVTTIEEDAFSGCIHLKELSVSPNVVNIGKNAFLNCGLYHSFTLLGKSGSSVEQYAKANNLTFVDIYNLKYADVTGLKEKTYTGSAIKQAPVVKIHGKVLKNGTDYTLSYKKNINAGTAAITITGKGSYKGTKTVNFKIKKASQSITAKALASSVAVGKTTTVTITGAEGNKSYKSSDTTIATVTSAGTVTARKVGTVKITATSAATENYNAASKTVTIKVVPAATASLTAANQATGIKLTWKKVTGANGYKVYRGSTLIKTITSGSTVSFADTKANTNGTKYIFKVVAKGTTGDSTLSKSVTVYRVARPAISSAANSAAGKMTVKWGKNAKATGYQIQCSTDKTFKSGNKSVTITSASTVSKVIASLTKGKTYYIRIRTYKTVGSAKYWSEWSAVKSVKISK